MYDIRLSQIDTVFPVEGWLGFPPIFEKKNDIFVKCWILVKHIKNFPIYFDTSKYRVAVQDVYFNFASCLF